MRISDWSSDVCSSDLWATPPWSVARATSRPRSRANRPRCAAASCSTSEKTVPTGRSCPSSGKPPRQQENDNEALVFPHGHHPVVCRAVRTGGDGGERIGRVQRSVLRSEEHTSELQSLMRISYAVFCLK